MASNSLLRLLLEENGRNAGHNAPAAAVVGVERRIRGPPLQAERSREDGGFDVREAVRVLRAGVRDCLGTMLVVEPMLVDYFGIRDYGEIDYGGSSLYVVSIDNLPEEVRGYAEGICRRLEAEQRRRERATVTLPAYLVERARRLAYMRGVTLNELVEKALEIGLSVLEKRYRVLPRQAR